MTDSSPPWWSMPLPQGWEAKYDSQNARYFFINHRAHQTTWEDPRQAVYQAQQAGALPYATAPPKAQPPHQPGHVQGNLYPGRRDQGGQTNTSLSNTGGVWRPQSIGRPAGNSGHSTPQTRATPDSSRSRHLTPTAPRQPPESIPLQDMKPQWQQDVETKYNLNTNLMRTEVDETEFEQLYEKIQIMFPFAEADVIRSMLSSNSFSEEKTVKILQEMGYKMQTISTQNRITAYINKLKKSTPNMDETELQEAILAALSETRSTASANVSRTQSPSTLHSPSRAISPGGNRTYSPSRKQSPAPGMVQQNQTRNQGAEGQPPKSRITVAQKREMRLKFEAAFKSESRNVVIMALEACDYDEARTTALLTNMANKENAQPHQYGAASKQPHAQQGRQHVSTPKQQSTPNKQPKNSTSSESSKTSASSTTHSPIRSTQGVLKSSSETNVVPPPSGKNTKTETEKQFLKEKMEASDQCSYRSANCMTPQGPNKNLPHGPNTELLLDQYVQEMGHNKDLCCGPLRENTMGPCQQTCGPSKQHISGPQGCLAEGPLKSNVTGPAYSGTVGSVAINCGPQGLDVGPNYKQSHRCLARGHDNNILCGTAAMKAKGISYSNANLGRSRYGPLVTSI